MQSHEKAGQLVEMEPKEHIIFNKTTKEISSLIKYDNKYISWKDGKLAFNQDPMSEVIKKLSRWYNVDIQIKDPELFNFTYTATFIDETLPQVLELLELVTPINYSISSRKQDSNGIFNKRKVVLSYRKKLNTNKN